MYQGGVSLRRIDCSRGGYSPGGDHEPDCFNDTKCPRLFYDSQEGLLYKRPGVRPDAALSVFSLSLISKPEGCPLWISDP